MNLLIITNNPQRASFRQRVSIYLDALHEAAIDCEVAKLPRGALARRRLFRRAQEFDGVFLHKKILNFFDAHWLRRYSRKIIYDFDDAVMYSPTMPEHYSLAHWRRFGRTAGLADVVIAGNSYLADHARRFNRNVHILPTGLDTSAYVPQGRGRQGGSIRLVWIGSKSTLKYLALIRPALEKIGSQFSRAVLRIICDEFMDFEDIEVEKRVWSEQTEVADLKQCDIGIAPLPDDRFTRGKCGFKILQYAAAGLPAVASSTGVNSEYVQENVTGFVASDTEQWYKRIAELIKNPDLRRQMGCKAGEFVEQFDSRVLGAQLVRVIRECVGG